MSWKTHDYDKIPGSYVFDGKTASGAYGLDKLLGIGILRTEQP